jgi:hypothetical protein
MYSQAMKRANGANVGRIAKITRNEATKFKIPNRQFLAEFCKAPSIVLISEVKRFRILPIGVTSKNREGARVNLVRSEIKRDREA